MLTPSTSPSPSHTPISKSEYDTIRTIIYKHSRISLGDSKTDLLVLRLNKRLHHLHLHSYSDYIHLLQSPNGQDELTHLIDAISTNHTFFFRESQHFHFLQSHILPNFHSLFPKSQKLHIWSAACSSGEEPASIAITLNQFLHHSNSPLQWSVDCSDISTKMLAKAQAAIFPHSSIQKIPPYILHSYFLKGTNHFHNSYKLSPKLTSSLKFHQINLLQNSYPFNHKFHVIFCRNVMIYFDPQTQQELLNKIHNSLAHNGFLFIGHSENLLHTKHNFSPVLPSIFQKTSV